MQVKVYRSSTRDGHSSSRFKASAVAKGNLLIFVDTTVVVNHGWIQPLIAKLLDEPNLVAVPHYDDWTPSGRLVCSNIVLSFHSLLRPRERYEALRSAGLHVCQSVCTPTSVRSYISTSSSAVADEPTRSAASRQTAKVLKQSRDPNHAPFVSDTDTVCHLVARIDIAYLCTKFDDFGFSRSSDMIGAAKCLMGHMNWPRPYQGIVIRSLWLAHSTCTSDLKPLRSSITKMHKATQNVETEVV